jgi:undecaprenyl-diphosphatase
VRLGATDSFDRALLLAMRRSADLSMAGPRWLPQAALDITGLGSTTIVFSGVAALAIFLTFRRRGRDAFWLSVCVATGYVLMRVLKVAFDRPRPEIVAHAVRVTDVSFPSGHAMLAAITYWTVAAVVTRGQYSHGARILIWSIASLLILMIGLTRVYLGVHWPTDVLAGWIAGAVWAMFWCLLARSSAS